MEINISENEMNNFSLAYVELKKQLHEVNNMIEQACNRLEELESKHDKNYEDYFNADKLYDDKKGEIYNNKKYFLSKKERGHGFKLFLIILGSNFFACFIPKLVVPIAISSLIYFMSDIVLFTKKHSNKYAHEFYESDEYIKMKSDLDTLELNRKNALDIFNSSLLSISQCNDEIKGLYEKKRNIEEQIAILKNSFFEKVIGYENVYEEPIILERK